MNDVHSELYEGIEGIREWLDDVTSTFRWKPYRFETVKPDPAKGVPYLKIYANPLEPKLYLTITPPPTGSICSVKWGVRQRPLAD